MLLTACLALLGGSAATAPGPKGTVSAVGDLLDRVLPGARASFELSFIDSCPGVAADASGDAAKCYTVSDASGGKIAIAATSASELASGLGYYLREHCNMTIGWARGGGSAVATLKKWPAVGTAVTRSRNTPWSYMMNVCTHSYSLVWYGWKEWSAMIDWMALSGLNLVLAMTGQEEVQYKVFQKFGLNDTEIRDWFNGPAFLTWSRGQNEYGNKIAGPLPRSWMKSQWALQKQILARYRSLGIVGELPAFQGNVPIAMKTIHADANITKSGDTGWMTSTDPLFAKIADVWMETLIEDFGTDHWYQLDGYFNGGTAPWMELPTPGQATALEPPRAPLPACAWSAELNGSYLKDCPSAGCTHFSTLHAAQVACIADATCGGVTSAARGAAPWQLRRGTEALRSPTAEASYAITNVAACRPADPGPDGPGDALWATRGAAAYMGVNRTDPDAIWSFQGWAFVGWSGEEKASWLKGFTEAVPAGKFVVIDMSTNGDGEWKKWNDAAFWNAEFIWTTLHDFGGTDGLKGNLTRINEIPFPALPAEAAKPTGVVGTGFTPEGIDQNPAYYEFMLDANFRHERVKDISAHIVARSHRRYGLDEVEPTVTEAWNLLVESVYSQDVSVQDGTGVPHLPGSWSGFTNRYTPGAKLCQTWSAWGKLIEAAELPSLEETREPFNYDLINTGRELLAELATPMSQNFSDATTAAAPLDAQRIAETGARYSALLDDLDALVATESAFLVGPWIAMARALAGNATDCSGAIAPTVKTCGDFYEWNARVQLSTWNPVPYGAKAIPGGPIDYASKHWSGLIKDYYSERAKKITAGAIAAAKAGTNFSKAADDDVRAHNAYAWQTSTNVYPTKPVGKAADVSKAVRSKYASYYASCPE